MKLKRFWGAVAVMSLPIGVPSTVQGAGFQVVEHGAVGLGRAYAGEAAFHQDPSVLSNNAAGIAFIKRPMFSGAFHYIQPFIDVAGSYTFNPDFPLTSVEPLTEDDDDIAPGVLVPALYGNIPITEQWYIGLGAYTDFGFITDYDRDFAGVLQAKKSELITGNINLSLAWKPTAKFSVAAGINAVYADVELSSEFSDGTLFVIPQVNRAIPLDSVGFFEADGDDWGLGWNLGVMFKPYDNWTVGFSFRSETEIRFKGDIVFFERSNDPSGVLYPRQSRDASAEVDLPAVWEGSFHWQAKPSWALHGSVKYNGWNSFDELRIDVSPPATVFGQPVSRLSVRENWNPSWRVALGATIELAERWSLRSGIAFDESPVKPRFRTLRIPDQDRWWWGVGFSFNQSKRWRHDAGLALIYSDSAHISDPLDEEILFGQWVGRAKSGGAAIVGYQFNVAF